MKIAKSYASLQFTKQYRLVPTKDGNARSEAGKNAGGSWIYD